MSSGYAGCNTLLPSLEFEVADQAKYGVGLRLDSVSSFMESKNPSVTIKMAPLELYISRYTAETVVA